MRNTICVFTAAGAAAMVAAACNRDVGATTTTTGAGIVTPDNAVSYLTAERCEREIDCNNVGTGKSYDDRGACERAVAHDLQSDLRPATCTYGVREDRMNECLQATKNAPCGNPLDTVSHLATCRPSRLCIR